MRAKLLRPVLLAATALVVLGSALQDGGRLVRANQLTGITAISAGGGTTCALTTAGGLKCWGNNQFGQAGNGTCTDVESPTGNLISTTGVPADVVGLSSDVVAMDAGGSHTCAVTQAGGVKCWGYNGLGELGLGRLGGPEICNHKPCSTTPVDVAGLSSGITAVSAGVSHTCALTEGGEVKCWGYDEYGRLGNGSDMTTVLSVPEPVDVSGLSDAVAISAGGSHTCALTRAGGVKCWGRNFAGQLGNGTITDSSTPTDVSGLTSGVAAISAGGSHTCALTRTGAVKCWGANYNGSLGNGSTTVSLTPVEVHGLSSGIVAIAAGSGTCALTSGGGVKCWGYNGLGGLGNGTRSGPETCGGFACSTVPVDVTGLDSRAVAIASGGHTCALAADQHLRCWGSNLSGQLGNGSIVPHSTTPTHVVELEKTPNGDVDCDGTVDPIDAALVLQYRAFFAAAFTCPQNANVNQDVVVNTIDAALILQLAAGIIDVLPP